MFRISLTVFINSFKPKKFQRVSWATKRPLFGFQRTISQSSVLYKKSHVERENNYYYNYFKNNGRYKYYLWPEDRYLEERKATKLTKEELLQEINESLNNKCSLLLTMQNIITFGLDFPDSKTVIDYSHFSKVLTENISTIIDKDLCQLLYLYQYFPETIDNHESRNFLWKTIDQECNNRSVNWDYQILFQIMDLWKTNHLTKKSSFVWNTLNRMGRRLSKLTPEQAVLLLYHINLSRHLPPSLSNFDIEHQLVTIVDKLDIIETAVISLGGFKTRTKFKNHELVRNITEKVCNKLSELDEIPLASLCKMIRYSLPLSQYDLLYYLQTKLMNEVSRLSHTCLCHIASLGTSVLVFQPELIEVVLHEFKQNIDAARLKDIERMLFTYSLFNVKDDDFINIVLANLRGRNEEMKMYPATLINALKYLITSGHYDYEFINRVLTTDYILTCKDKHYSYDGVSFIDFSVELEQPDYKGNRLPADVRRTIARNEKFKVESNMLTNYKKFSYEVQDTLIELYGEKFVSYATVLQHFYHGDLVIGFDRNLQPVDIDQEWRKVNWGVCKKTPDYVNKWLCIVLCAGNQTVRPTQEYLGTLLCKLRQLETLGFIPIVVQQSTWLKTGKKLEFVKELVLKTLQERRKVVDKVVTTCS